MKAMKHLLVSAVLLVMAATLFSNSAECGQQQMRRGHGGPPPCPLMMALDTDGDHAISETEMKSAESVLKALDSDGDGILKDDELQPEPPSEDDRSGRQRPQHDRQPPPSPVFSVLDSNSDGTIDSDELSQAVDVLMTLDQDSDGQLSREELHPRGMRGPRR